MVLFWPNSKYTVREFLAVVPLEKRKQTDILLLEGYKVLETVVLVTSSKVIDEA
jgi:hypothetical protein